MSYARIQHGGGAVTTTLSSDITSGASSLTLVSSTGWPDGSTGPFYLVIDAGLSTEEKILATSRSGAVLSGLTRGTDGTSAAAHTAGATIKHIFSAAEADEANQVVKATLGSLTTKGDLLPASAANTMTRLGVGADNTVLVADSAQTVGMKWATLGSSSIATGAITTTQILDGTIATGDIADGAITSAKILDGTIATADIASGAITSALIADGTVTGTDIATGTVALGNLTSAVQQEVVQITTSGARPGSPTEGQFIYETDTHKLQQYTTGTSTWVPGPWNLAWGSFGGAPYTIVTDVTGFTGVADVTGWGTAGVITFTVPTANRYTEIRFEARATPTAIGGTMSSVQCAIYVDNVSAGRHDFVWYPSAGNSENVWASYIGTLSAGSHTVKVQFGRSGNDLGTYKLEGTVCPLKLFIKDIGPSTSPA